MAISTLSFKGKLAIAVQQTAFKLALNYSRLLLLKGCISGLVELFLVRPTPRVYAQPVRSLNESLSRRPLAWAT